MGLNLHIMFVHEEYLQSMFRVEYAIVYIIILWRQCVGQLRSKQFVTVRYNKLQHFAKLLTFSVISQHLVVELT